MKCIIANIVNSSSEFSWFVYLFILVFVIKISVAGAGIIETHYNFQN